MWVAALHGIRVAPPPPLPGVAELLVLTRPVERPRRRGPGVSCDGHSGACGGLAEHGAPGGEGGPVSDLIEAVAGWGIVMSSSEQPGERVRITWPHGGTEYAHLPAWLRRTEGEGRWPLSRCDRGRYRAAARLARPAGAVPVVAAQPGASAAGRADCGQSPPVQPGVFNPACGQPHPHRAAQRGHTPGRPPCWCWVWCTVGTAKMPLRCWPAGWRSG